MDEKKIVSSTGALSFASVPEKLVIIGGGIIGLELGSVWSRLGSQVTVVEYMDSIGAGMDGSTAAAFHKMLEKQGIKFRLGTKVVSASASSGDMYEVTVEPSKGGPSEKASCVSSLGTLPWACFFLAHSVSHSRFIFPTLSWFSCLLMPFWFPLVVAPIRMA